MDDDYDPWQDTADKLSQREPSKRSLPGLSTSNISLQTDVPSIEALTQQLFQLASTDHVRDMQDLLSTLDLHYPSQKASLLKSADDNGTPALCYAACFGSLDMCRLLVEHGTPIDQQDRQGWTPLAWAMNNGHDVVAKYLQGAGAMLSTQMTNTGLTLEDFMATMSNNGRYDLK